VELSKSATEIFEMPREALGEHSLSLTAAFEWHSRFGAGRCQGQLKMMNVQCDKAPTE
jgi:hypothetical protein